MRSLRFNIFITVLMWLVIALCAWPVFVAANYLVGMFVGEGSVIDSLQQEPVRKIAGEFLNGYKSSAVIALLIGLVAAIDFLLFSRNNLTGYIAGFLVPVFCIAIAFIYFPNPGMVLPGFALTGLFLWIIYKCIDIGSRIRRVRS